MPYIRRTVDGSWEAHGGGVTTTWHTSWEAQAAADTAESRITDAIAPHDGEPDGQLFARIRTNIHTAPQILNDLAVDLAEVAGEYGDNATVVVLAYIEGSSNGRV